MSDAENDLSEDESEILVYVEFEGYADSSTFKNEKLKLDIAGIDSDHPIMQINGKFYEGTYHDAVGTYMFFEKDEAPVVDDPIFDTPATLKYFAKTRKLLKMERVFAMQRTEVLGDSDHTYCIPNMETIKEAGVPPKYQDDALQFWINMRDDRMQALTTYLEKQQIREEKRLKGIELDSESDDDNPFAMYKPKKDKEAENRVQQPQSRDKKSNETDDITDSEETDIANMLNVIMDLDPSSEMDQDSPKKPVKKLTVIDPGPSTSKKRDPDMPSMSFKKKRKGTVKVLSKSKSKDVFKKPNKRAPKSKKSLQISTASHDVDKSIEIDSPEVRAEPDPRESGELNMLGMMEETGGGEKNNSENVEEESTSEKAACLITKKLEKQARREAKMKEISERLKTHKEELLRVNSSGDLPPDSEKKDK